MDWLTFAAGAIRDLAWPLTALVIVLVLKRPLRDLIPAIKKLRYKHLEIEFNESVRRLSSRFQRVVAVVPKPPEQQHVRGRLRQLADISPRAAILESWLHLEAAATEAIEKLKLTSSDKTTLPPMRIGKLLSGSVLNADEAAIFNELRSLRNAAVHIRETHLSPAQVEEYIEVALGLAALISDRTAA